MVPQTIPRATNRVKRILPGLRIIISIVKIKIVTQAKIIQYTHKKEPKSLLLDS